MLPLSRKITNDLLKLKYRLYIESRVYALIDANNTISKCFTKILLVDIYQVSIIYLQLKFDEIKNSSPSQTLVLLTGVELKKNLA